MFPTKIVVSKHGTLGSYHIQHWNHLFSLCVSTHCNRIFLSGCLLLTP